ncbi:PLP-dependent transferase [Candidatus Saccharibacteria bacterium]|nr:PLP-dependent transferase [Candidatus Saccharibacteria bacterium]
MATYDSRYNYIRSTSLQRTELEEQYAKLYGVRYAKVFPSGTNAIYNAIQVVLQGNQGTFLYSSELYSGTRTTVIRELSKIYSNIAFVAFNPAGNDLKEKLAKHGDVCCVFVESVSNPKAIMVDWELLKGIPLIVDNTWMTPLMFNPFKVGARIVVESCSKYLSNGKCIAGICCTNNKLSDFALQEIIRIQGLHVSQEHCRLVCKGLENLPNILQSISQRVPLKLLQENADAVIYPTLNDHPTRARYVKYAGESAPGVIVFGFRSTRFSGGQWKKILYDAANASGIPWSTSFGKEIDLIDAWPKKQGGMVWVRLSIGYNDTGLEEKLLKFIRCIKF